MLMACKIIYIEDIDRMDSGWTIVESHTKWMFRGQKFHMDTFVFQMFAIFVILCESFEHRFQQKQKKTKIFGTNCLLPMMD